MIQNVSFDLEDKTEAFSSARTHAVQKAKQKAQELTKET
ncbi:SIMPL domain-containing protein [bacterium]|nr:SIMPL domain-containing protein [bacterium]